MKGYQESAGREIEQKFIQVLELTQSSARDGVGSRGWQKDGERMVESFESHLTYFY